MSFETIRKGSLEYLISTIIPMPHCFTTRYGGVSEGHLGSLNLGRSRGDDPERVFENYRILGDAVGFDVDNLVFTRQVHGDVVVTVGKADCKANNCQDIPVEGRDGLVTGERDVALTVFSADCTTILLCDSVQEVVAAVHSGWRGTALGIVKRAVEKMQQEFSCRPEDICAAIGPCIGRCCFETHRDVPDAMLAALGVDALPAIDQISERPEKFFVDLKLLNEIWLRKAGVTQIDVCPDCTACQPERFWSHRRVGNQRGSMAAIITR